MQDKPLEKKSQSPLYQQLMARLKNDILGSSMYLRPGERVTVEELLYGLLLLSLIHI